MNVFLSSVRHGLEEERDALPGMILALGHEPRRFEDYTAQTVPSRQASLAGVEGADAYVLFLGEHYGDPLPDTGKSPTEEEFAVAKRRGIPILAFRKRGVTFEPAQQAFVQRVEDYSTGVFRNGFSNATELLPEVARAIRESSGRRPLSTSSLSPDGSPSRGSRSSATPGGQLRPSSRSSRSRSPPRRPLRQPCRPSPDALPGSGATMLYSTSRRRLIPASRTRPHTPLPAQTAMS